MIRGAIDYIAGDRVGGWLYSDEASTKTRTVLAFLDGACIGAGKIEQYREDLADAGLGDGYVGFNFGIDPVKWDDRSRVTVRVEGSDLQLIQKGASIANQDAAAPVVSSAKPPRAVEWMLAQGWLSHDEYDYLKLLGATGGYERSLHRPKSEGGGLEDPLPIAEAYLGLIAQDAIVLDEIDVADATELADIRADLVAGLAQTIVAVSAAEKAEIIVTKPAAGEDEPALQTGFTIAPDRLSLLDLACVIEAGETVGAGLKIWAVKPGAV